VSLALPTREDVLRLLRSFASGAGATLADLAVLSLLVGVAHVDPRVASVPALLTGGIANFFLHRHFAFRARRGSLRRQAAGYTAVEIASLVLNGVVYDLVLRVFPHAAPWYWAVRLATTNVVYLGFSYPLWRRVFSVPREDAMA
jgi:putative flippase GtrA